ncbi:MAG: fibronectin type III domain-containing protein, partial [Actinomycetales bacterium]|nr:fibronectin type III domain-containing protein [Actinomycetales bacterium]
MRRLAAVVTACVLSNLVVSGPGLVHAAPSAIVLQPLSDREFTIVAAAPMSDVLTDTGDGTNATHISNGVGWYYSDNYSWGFVKAGDEVDRRWCDAGGILDGWANPGARLCWHMAGGRLQAGWSAGAIGVSSSADPPAYRAIYVADTPSYYPYGPTPNVTQSALQSGGWTLCFSSLYWNVGDGHPGDAGLGTPMSDIRSACQGKYMLLAGMAGHNNSWVGAPAIVQMPGTDHWYQFVPGYASWEDAKVQSESRTFRGMQGHLATVTSPEEHSFLLSLLGPVKDVLLGGRDLGPSGGYQMTWAWDSGPESGTVFSRCRGARDCDAVGQPTFWDYRQPDNGAIRAVGATQPYLMMAWNAGPSGWDDVHNGWQGLGGYLVEYEPGRPAEPQTLIAAPGDGSATLSWSPPSSDGGATISSYSVTASPGGQSCTTSGLSCTVAGLTNRQVYTFTVIATNSAGTSEPSAPSAPVMPLAPGFQVWPVDAVVAVGSATTVNVAQAGPGSAVAVSGAMRASLLADLDGFASSGFAPVKAGVHRFSASYSAKSGRRTTKFTASAVV